MKMKFHVRWVLSKPILNETLAFFVCDEVDDTL
jgi:hypothetical protein